MTDLPRECPLCGNKYLLTGLGWHLWRGRWESKHCKKDECTFEQVEFERTWEQAQEMYDDAKLTSSEWASKVIAKHMQKSLEKIFPADLSVRKDTDLT